MSAPKGIVASWDGEPVVRRTGNGGWCARIDSLDRELSVKPREVAFLKAMLQGDPVTVELAQAIVDAAERADPSTGSG